jgi:hypothetical protein
MKTNRLFVIAPLAALLFGWCVLAATAEEGRSAGAIYGAVKTRAGKTYTGVIRWGNEEAFWDDHFNATKEKLPYAEYRDELADVGHSHGIRIFGHNLFVDVGASSRQFVARFGDIRKIEVDGSDEATITMKNGAVIGVEGGSNDIGATLLVRDAAGDIEIPWRKIDVVELMATPNDAMQDGQRLFGTVTTEDGEFTGYIQWDKQECLTSDKLDGDSDDGEMSIAMGKIRSIERRGYRGSEVTLRDGRRFELDDTNDVDDSNRGIMVEDPRYGRVVVPWGAFERLDLRAERGSGRGYEHFEGGGPLWGTVTDRDGRKHTGRIVFDLDEGESWEMLNGDRDDVEYNIPFELIDSIAPRDDDEAVVTLKSGEEITLEGGQDASDSNDGILVLPAKAGRPKLIPWDEVRRIDFDWRDRQLPAEAEEAPKREPAKATAKPNPEKNDDRRPQ